MRPLMLLLGRLDANSVQETHPWHVERIDPSLVAEDGTVVVNGKKEAVSGRFGPLFHMFGGWRHYVALQAEPPFHIGWLFSKNNLDKPSQSAINRLQIDSDTVRMLSGPQGTETRFFAVSPSGKQVPLRKVGQGVLGDDQFPDTRLL